ncbi:MAG: DNA double-strand break repair nuclease NurA [Candidatus Bathyarchaeota archaeon]|nr:MAG: DNA double-strand break repair nuclease NurA [Candidatus Bathyarchaeota archaeon]
MSYTELNIEDVKESREKMIEVFQRRRFDSYGLKEKINVGQASGLRSRKILAVDSGFNSAYETTFTIFKAAIVNEAMNVTENTRTCFFQVDNQSTDRLKRLIMQETLYESLIKTIKTGKADRHIAIVDGTITLTIFHPTTRDNIEYREHFNNLVQEYYKPLMKECHRRDIILLGFLKQTGSTYLTEHINAGNLYDRHVIDTILRTHGEFISPIPITKPTMGPSELPFKYVTFYLNLKGWNYRFELLSSQESYFSECIQNMLFWSTRTHFGMNPIFSKADEHARVTKRKTNLIFNYLTNNLPETIQSELLHEVQKRTHFGYHRGDRVDRLMKNDN